MIEIQNIPGKGRGVISTKKISKGTLIESAPTGAIPESQISTINETEVFKYYFVQPKEYSRNKNVKGYLVFGIVSLCNHSDEPNAKVSWIANNIGFWSNLIAVRDIEVGEEVTIYYTNFDQYLDGYQFT